MKRGQADSSSERPLHFLIMQHDEKHNKQKQNTTCALSRTDRSARLPSFLPLVPWLHFSAAESWVWKRLAYGTHAAFIIQDGCVAPDVTRIPPPSSTSDLVVVGDGAESVKSRLCGEALFDHFCGIKVQHLTFIGSLKPLPIKNKKTKTVF